MAVTKLYLKAWDQRYISYYTHIQRERERERERAIVRFLTWPYSDASKRHIALLFVFGGTSGRSFFWRRNGVIADRTGVPLDRCLHIFPLFRFICSEDCLTRDRGAK